MNHPENIRLSSLWIGVSHLMQSVRINERSNMDTRSTENKSAWERNNYLLDSKWRPVQMKGQYHSNCNGFNLISIRRATRRNGVHQFAMTMSTFILKEVKPQSRADRKSNHIKRIAQKIFSNVSLPLSLSLSLSPHLLSWCVIWILRRNSFSLVSECFGYIVLPPIVWCGITTMNVCPVSAKRAICCV